MRGGRGASVGYSNWGIDLGNDDGIFMVRVLAAVAAKESGRKSERLKRKA